MSHNRGKIYVDKRVQGALARRIVFHWCIFFVLSMICLFALEYFLGDPARSMSQHAGAVWQKYSFFILLMLTIVPSFVYDALKLSNRFVGPMVRLRNSITQLADGEKTDELKFREGDFWQDVSVEFNRMLERVEHSESESEDSASAEDNQVVNA